MSEEKDLKNLSVEYVPDAKTNRVKIITENGDVWINPGEYVTIGGLTKMIHDRGHKILESSVRTHVYNRGDGIDLRGKRIIPIQEAMGIIARIGMRGKPIKND